MSTDQFKSFSSGPQRNRAGQIRFDLLSLLVAVGLVLLGFWYSTLTHVHHGESSTRVKCASNLKAIGNAMVLYANANQKLFPQTQWVDGAMIDTSNHGFAEADPFAVKVAPGAVNNLPQAMFQLIRQGDLPPAVFVCPQSAAQADAMGGLPATERSNFTGDGTLGGSVLPNVSYSFVNVYPSSRAQAMGYPKLLTKFHSDFAVAADISPARIDSPIWAEIRLGAPRSAVIAGNSPNHDRDGQNVLYADGHAEFQPTPLCGRDNDNIYTPAGTTPGKLGVGESARGMNADPRLPMDSVLLLNAK